MNAIPNKYCAILEKYHLPGYFTHPLYQKMKQALVNHGWASVHSAEELLSRIKQQPPENPDNLFDYQCCLFSLHLDPIIRGDPLRFPQILFLDRAILPFCCNKLTMNWFFHQLDKTRNLRPIWAVYQKGDPQDLSRRILSDIPGDIVVIKPIQSTMGRGVIIVDKQDLASTLEYILHSPKELLIKDPERSYSQYARDSSEYFIIEEFIPSDPLFFEQEPYDCTMRVTALLSYHQKIADVTFLSEYWYSPSKPTRSEYTLIQSHKAKGTHFCTVAPDVSVEVRRQLYPALLEAYRHMLDQHDTYIHFLHSAQE